MSQFITDWFSHATARKVSTLSYNTHARDRKLRTSNIDSTHPFDKFILDDGDLSEIHLESSQIQKGLEDTSQELLCRVDKQASDKKNKLLHDQGISSRRCFHSTRTILKETLLPTYLSSIKEIINMADKAEAQKDIEKKWLSLAKESVDGVKQIHKHRFDVIDDLRISLAKASVNSFRYIPAVLRKYVGGDESLLIAVAMISNTVRAVSETHLALLIG